MTDTAQLAESETEAPGGARPVGGEPPTREKPAPDGLTQAEAEARLAKYGYNELAEKEVNPLVQFLGYFWGPIPWMIEAAAILSAVIGHWTDFTIIAVLLAANAVVGFWEEHQAGNAVAALKKKLALTARVKRDGKWKSLPARQLVPGDLVRLRIGDIIPADAKLLEGDPVEVDQSALTGESLPVEHKTGEAVYSGSILRMGEIDAEVTATGAKTYFGKTAGMVQEAHTTSHFQRAVLKIGDYLIVIAAALVLLIVVVALYRHETILVTLRFALVLTVAAIPVAMPTVLSVTLAVGARLLSAKEAIVTRLAAVEEVAGVDVLCSDKTGTLTQNKLRLGEPFAVEGVEADDVVLAGALASRQEDDDPIDLAVLAGLSDPGARDACRITHFQPFDPVHKRTEAAVVGGGGKRFKVTKGAPQVVLAMSDNARQVGPGVDEAVSGFAKRGFRSLGVARADGEGGWRFLGVLPLFDPPREDSRPTIEAARAMGVKVKMVTGDQIAIAKETAAQLGLGANIADAGAFGDTEHHMSGQLADAIERADGFAQVFPEHKYHIVEVLQQRKHIVGMTGDGVNDAPALKKADAGIAVSGATDAARAAADIVLLSAGLSIIIDAIKESRKIFRRMTNYAIYRIAETIRVLLFMTLTILLFNFYPVTAVMIVLLALLNDGAILSIAYDNVRGSDRPERWNMHQVLGIATALGLMGVVETFGLLYIFVGFLPHEWNMHVSREVLQTIIYLKLSVAGHLTVFVARTRGPFWSSRPAAVLLAAVIGTQTAATLISVYGLLMPAIGWGFAAFVWGYALVWFLIEDRVKLAAYRIFDVAQPGLLSRRRRAA